MKNNDIITRFPPSPTGFFHIGNARTFLFNYLFTKQNGGQIVFRLEDTDKERSKEEYAKDIMENLKWLKIEPDFSTTVRQSERSEIYKRYLGKLLEEGKAYVSKEEVVDENQRAEVIRFKNPNKKVSFEDLIRGTIEFDTTELGNFVIAKSLEEPIYHLAVVIDDYEMGVNHVIRGDDGISNTPRQILIQEAIGAPRPTYAHLPMMLDEDKTKLSKRKHGEKVSVSYYRNSGYLPEAMLNFLSMVGWNPGTDQEIFTLEELTRLFDIKKVQKSGAIFNVEKLDWINKEHLKLLPKENILAEFKTRLPEIDEGKIEKLYPVIFERINKYGDIEKMKNDGDFDYYVKKPTYKEGALVWAKGEATAEKTADILDDIIELLENNKENFSEPDSIKNIIWTYAEKKGRGETLWPMRYALSGKEKSPDPFTLSYILGKEEVIDRLKDAIKILRKK